jgi:hypothetical protein
MRTAAGRRRSIEVKQSETYVEWLQQSEVNQSKAKSAAVAKRIEAKKN